MRSVVVALFLLCAGAIVEARAEGIAWHTDLKQASVAAQKANLPLFIDFWAEWCAPCKAMDANVYTHPAVIDAFKRRIVGVRLHFDLHRDLARTYNVGALPHLVFANSHGMPLVFHRGYLGAGDLASVVSAIPPIGGINALDLRLRKDRNNFADLLAMARALRTAGFFEAGIAYYDRAFRHDGARGNAAVRQAILYETALSWIELKDGGRAAALLEKSLKERPASTADPEVLLALGRAYALSGRPDRARHSFEAVVRYFPQSSAAARARALIGGRQQ